MLSHPATARRRRRDDARNDPGERRGGRIRVLLVGHGPPISGGIPSFVVRLLDDERLSRSVAFGFLNTARSGPERPGGFTAANLARLVADAAALWRAARIAHVVHLNVAPAPLAPLARAAVMALVAKSRGVPVVLHAHSGRMHAFVHRAPYRLLLRATVRIVDRFVVVSDIERLAVAATTGGSPKVVRIENAIEATRFSSGPKRTPPELVFVGTVCERKGLFDLEQALGDLERRGLAGPRVLDVTIVGDGKQEGPHAFDQVHERYRRLPWVRFTGALPAEAVADTLAGASIFCLPSHWEGFPLSVLEAMAAEAAVVATAVGDVPHILDGGRAGRLVAPRAPGDLADAIGELVESPARRGELGRAGRRRVIDVFTGERLAQAILGVYADVTRDSRGP